MPRLPYQTLTTPNGVDLTSDPMSVPASRALMLMNFLFDHAGNLRGYGGLTTAVVDYSLVNAFVDGMCYYYGATVINPNPNYPSSSINPTITTDVILVFQAGSIYPAFPPYSSVYPAGSNPHWPVEAENYVTYGSQPGTANYAYITRTPWPNGNSSDYRIRTAILGSEVVVVSQAGMQPVRFKYQNTQSPYGNISPGNTVLAQCGINAPPAPYLKVWSESGSGMGEGTYQYFCTYYDEEGRESSPSPVSTVVVPGNNDYGVQVLVYMSPTANTSLTNLNVTPPPFAPDTQIQGINLYRTTANGTVFYRIAQAGFFWGVTIGIQLPNTTPTMNNPISYEGQSSSIYNPGISGSNNNLWYRYAIQAQDYFYNYTINPFSAAPSGAITLDIASDSFIQNEAIGPNFSEYNPPEPASLICIHQNKIFMNVLADNSLIQCSCTLAPTQYTLVPGNPIIATDGVQLQIGTDQGDPVTGFLSLGNLLCVFKRRSAWFLLGDNIENFILRPEGSRGCIAPDTAIRCNDMGLFLSDDGVYAISYGATTGLGVNKISKEIEGDLLSNYEVDLEAAFAIFAFNTYFLFVKTTCYFYMFDAPGWGLAQFGTGTVTLASGPINGTINTGNNNPFPGTGSGGSITPPVYTSSPPPITPVIPTPPVMPTTPTLVQVCTTFTITSSATSQTLTFDLSGVTGTYVGGSAFWTGNGNFGGPSAMLSNTLTVYTDPTGASSTQTLANTSSLPATWNLGAGIALTGSQVGDLIAAIGHTFTAVVTSEPLLSYTTTAVTFCINFTVTN